MKNGSLMEVESIAECSTWSILQYFQPALIGIENQLLVFFLNGRSLQVLLYSASKDLFFTFFHDQRPFFRGETEQILRFNNNPSSGPLVVWEIGKNKIQWFRRRQHDRQRDGWIFLTLGVPVFFPESRFRSRFGSSVLGPCLVMHYFVSFLVLQSS